MRGVGGLPTARVCFPEQGRNEENEYGCLRGGNREREKEPMTTGWRVRALDEVKARGLRWSLEDGSARRRRVELVNGSSTFVMI